MERNVPAISMSSYGRLGSPELSPISSFERIMILARHDFQVAARIRGPGPSSGTLDPPLPSFPSIVSPDREANFRLTVLGLGRGNAMMLDVIQVYSV